MSDSSIPLVSIGMPVLNCGATIRPAVQSILNQTFRDWELLVMDDGSRDDTLEARRELADARVRVFADGEHRGLVARLNQAIEVSRGKYFARMDGDDVSYPERLARQVEFLEAHPEVDLLAGGIVVFGRDGQLLGTREVPTQHESICRRPWAGFYLAHPTWMGRIEWFRGHRYRAEAVRCEDQDLLLRSYEVSRFAALPEIVLGYREEELSLKKLLVGRRSFARSVVREAMMKRQYAMALRGVAEQALKSLADCVAVGTGLNYRLLRHRALPADDTIRQRWAQLWGEVREGTSWAVGEKAAHEDRLFVR